MRINRREFARISIAAGALSMIAGPTALSAKTRLIKKPIPSSGELLPVIGLGTNRYGRAMTDEARAPLRAALERFHELGGTVIDTAPSYRESESVLGDLMSDLGNRDALFIATKTDRTGSREERIAQLERSSRKLKSDVIDLMQVHSLRGWKTSLPLLRERREAGDFRYIGITTSRESQYEEFEKIMKAEELDFVQVNYSLEQRMAEKRILPLAADRGMAVMINRGFGGGRIFNKVGDQPLPDWAANIQCRSWAQFLLKYAVSHPAATVVIPGMTKAHHVDDNLGAAYGRLPDAAQRKRMEEFYAAL